MLFPSFTNAQKSLVHFKSTLNRQPVPFVTVYMQGKVKAADANGEILLTGNSIHFTASHVTFEDSIIAITNIRTDTTIVVYLQEHVKSLSSLTLRSSDNYVSKKYFTSGNVHTKSNYVISLHSNLKVGILYKSDSQKAVGKYLRSLQLRMQNPKELGTDNFPLELKIFNVTGNVIDSVPTNKKQIIIFSKQFQPVTEVLVNQRIKIPSDGLFFSLELPPVFPNANLTVNLFAAFDNNGHCQLFVTSNSKPFWDPFILQKPCSRDDNGKAKKSIHSITYFDAK